MKRLIPFLRDGRQLTKGLLINRLALTLLFLGLVALLSHFTAGRVEAQAEQPTHQDLQGQITNLQTSVNTLQSKVDQVLPAWSQTLPAAERFVQVLRDAAVLDKETGLVWEKAPDAMSRDWFSAQSYCTKKTVGNRTGWRLPTVQELASLVDPSQSDPALPSGHPFTNVVLSYYWSATTNASDASSAWDVDLGENDVGVYQKNIDLFVWCVRGGHGGPDAQ